MPIRTTLALVAAFALSLPLSSESSARPSEPALAAAPSWFVEHMRFLTRGSGRFVADNEEYASPEEPFDAYGLEWSYGLGERSLRGRLFGLVEGTERGTFWEFRVYFDPATERVRMLQFGADGTVGDGWLAPAEPAGEGSEASAGRLASEQTFTAPGGPARRVRHESLDRGDKHATTSFEAAADGGWTPNRTYAWERAQG